MSEAMEFVAWREGSGVPAGELLASMGPGLAPGENTACVPITAWSRVAAAMAARLLRSIAQIPGMQEHETNMLVHAVAAMSVGGEHNEENRIVALMSAANLGIVTRIGVARTASVEGALSWFPRALAWAAHRACLDRKCPYNLPDLAAEAVSHHAALASHHGGDAKTAREAERGAQRRDVESALQGREIDLLSAPQTD
jgi:hypothetical protein